MMRSSLTTLDLNKSWTDLLHSSTKLLEQSAPSAQFPLLQRNLDQLDALSKKLKAKTLRTEVPSQSIAATRLLAPEGLNAEQLARDLKSFELKTTFEDVFPAEATTVEEYLQQVDEMAMVSAIQEAQKDNVRSFDDYMMKVLEEDWKMEKCDFLQSLSRISTLPKANIIDKSTGSTSPGQLVSIASSPQPTKSFKSAYESLSIEAPGGKSVNMQKIWHLIQTLTGEDYAMQPSVSRRMSLVIGARHHLEWGHEKYIMDIIKIHPTQAALGGAVRNLHRVHAFLQIRLRDYGVLDFDAGDDRRQPPVDTNWQQVQ
ncbi:hypothetical protein SLA2020_016590 [Shorea laevis]